MKVTGMVSYQYATIINNEIITVNVMQFNAIKAVIISLHYSPADCNPSIILEIMQKNYLIVASQISASQIDPILMQSRLRIT